MKLIANFLALFLPAKIAAWVDYLSGHRKFFFALGGPMNAQTARAEIVRELIERCDIESIIETGTFRGTSTEWFGSFGLPVLSVESVRRFAEFARIRFRKMPHVEIRTGNSVDLLKSLVARKEGLERRTLLYLDAHWHDHLPLREEYDLIRRHFPHAIIVVDDFQVPDDLGYAYDDYGPAKALTLDYFSQDGGIMPSHIFFPVTQARWETGHRRGCVVLATDPELADKIAKNIPLLRSWPIGSTPSAA